MNISNDQILAFLNSKNIQYEYFGDLTTIYKSYAPINNLLDYSFSFARNIKLINVSEINSFQGVLIFLNKHENTLKCNQIVVSNPHRVFFQILDYFFRDTINHEISIHSIIKTKTIGKNIHIGPYSYIGENVIIGDNVYISNNVTIKDNTIIGDNCIIESGCTIGVDGFGHFLDEMGNQIRVLHLGKVIIGKDVIIGSNTTISRGAISDTIISDGVKIDNLCHIAHNVKIGKRSMITACVEISGSVVIGEDVWIGPNSSIMNGIVIGSKSLVGLGSVVTRTIPKNKVAFGVPAKVIRENE